MASDQQELAQQQQALKDQGNALVSRSSYKLAISFYNKAIDCLPDAVSSAAVYSNRSLCFANLSCYWNALDDAKKAIELRPNWFRGHQRAADAAINIDRRQEAKRYAGQAIDTYLKHEEKQDNNLLAALRDAKKNIDAEVQKQDALDQEINRERKAYIDRNMQAFPVEMKITMLGEMAFRTFANALAQREMIDDVRIYGKKRHIRMFHECGLPLNATASNCNMESAVRLPTGQDPGLFPVALMCNNKQNNKASNNNYQDIDHQLAIEYFVSQAAASSNPRSITYAGGFDASGYLVIGGNGAPAISLNLINIMLSNNNNSKYGNRKIIIDLNGHDVKGMTLLGRICCQSTSHFEVIEAVRLLVRYTKGYSKQLFDPDIKMKMLDNTVESASALHYAVRPCEENTPELLTILVHGLKADVNAIQSVDMDHPFRDQATPLASVLHSGKDSSSEKIINSVVRCLIHDCGAKLIPNTAIPHRYKINGKLFPFSNIYEGVLTNLWSHLSTETRIEIVELNSRSETAAQQPFGKLIPITMTDDESNSGEWWMTALETAIVYQPQNLKFIEFLIKKQMKDENKTSLRNERVHVLYDSEGKSDPKYWMNLAGLVVHQTGKLQARASTLINVVKALVSIGGCDLRDSISPVVVSSSSSNQQEVRQLTLVEYAKWLQLNSKYHGMKEETDKMIKFLNSETM